MDLNAIAAAEHALEIEQKISITKERHCALSIHMPFGAAHGRIIVESIAFIVRWLNAFFQQWVFCSIKSMYYHV